MYSKPIISPMEFVDEVNKRLPFEHSYVPGMRIKLVPHEGSASGATGFACEGPSATSAVAEKVEAQVLEEYIVRPWPEDEDFLIPDRKDMN